MSKIRIIEINTTYGLVFTVGRQSLAYGEERIEVESIGYEKNGYNKGRQGEFPSYVIYFVGGILRRIIPQDKISSVVAEFTDGDANAEIAPPLPE